MIVVRQFSAAVAVGPGEYHFRVIACNSDGVWNEEGARLDFNIAPAWYQTIWFRGFYVLAFFTLLWGMYQMRIRQLQEQEERFRDAVETMPALAFAVDLKGNRTFMNRGWLEYTGLSREEASASGLDKTLHPDDLERVNTFLRHTSPRFVFFFFFFFFFFGNVGSVTYC